MVPKANKKMLALLSNISFIAYAIMMNKLHGMNPLDIIAMQQFSYSPIGSLDNNLFIKATFYKKTTDEIMLNCF